MIIMIIMIIIIIIVMIIILLLLVVVVVGAGLNISNVVLLVSCVGPGFEPDATTYTSVWLSNSSYNQLRGNECYQ